MLPVQYRPIGVIHSKFKEPQGTPIQASVAKGSAGFIEIFPEYVEGLQDIDGFSHIILLYHFHRAKEYRLRVRPYMDSQVHGVFATRSPSRPNAIGISVVRLVEVRGNTLHIEDVDVLDETPLLDIKPYVPQFDHREVSRIGWLGRNIDRLPHIHDDGRFAARS